MIAALIAFFISLPYPKAGIFANGLVLWIHLLYFYGAYAQGDWYDMHPLIFASLTLNVIALVVAVRRGNKPTQAKAQKDATNPPHK